MLLDAFDDAFDDSFDDAFDDAFDAFYYKKDALDLLAVALELSELFELLELVSTVVLETGIAVVF